MLTRYSLKAGPHIPEAITRMPTDWKLQGSINGKKWITLDSRSNQTQWKKDKVETFPIQNPGDYSYYRFIFQKGGDRSLIRIYEIEFFEKSADGKTKKINPDEIDLETYSR
jgi:hypothetical protein